MFVNIQDNKWQILISTIIGFLYYYFTKNEIQSMVLVIVLSMILRKMDIDNYINNKLK